MLQVFFILIIDVILGLIIYTGRDTRAVLNTCAAQTKIGALDLDINRFAKMLAVMTFVLALAMVAVDGFNGAWWIFGFRFLILFSSIIPISLRVNLDLGKAFFSYLISIDENITDTIVRSSNIPEELGRIDYLLTDKTGTLTKNGLF